MSWIRKVSYELVLAQMMATKIRGDNHNATQLANNLAFYAKTKNLEQDVHYVRDLVKDKIVELDFCRSEDHATNIFTNFTKTKFIKLGHILFFSKIKIYFLLLRTKITYVHPYVSKQSLQNYNVFSSYNWWNVLIKNLQEGPPYGIQLLGKFIHRFYQGMVLGKIFKECYLPVSNYNSHNIKTQNMMLT